MKHEKLVAKAFYWITLENVSPLSVGNDSNIITQHDVLRSDGVPFIPGTSIAGVISHYAKENGLSLLEEKQVESNRFCMSRVFYSDAKLVSGYTTPVRDGVALNKKKTAIKGAKYDYEVIDSGAKFELRIEVTLRENDIDPISQYDKEIKDALASFNNGDIVIGFKSKRGFGRVKVVELRSKVFEGNALSSLLDFNPNSKDEYDITPLPKKENSSILITMPYSISGGLSIRKYSTNVNEPDFVNLTSNKKTVIPGTSLAGVLRHRVQKVAEELKLGDLVSEIDTNLFGSANDANGVDLTSSKVRTSESILDGGHELITTRTAVNRFTGGSLNGALYTERTYIGGKGELQVLLPKDTPKGYVGIVLIVMNDIARGYAPIGGETSIGRGILESKSILINEKEVVKDGKFIDESYLVELAKLK